MARREDMLGHDTIEIMLDTFNDQRRAYCFVANPYGVQWDAIWTEGARFDGSFDTVWDSEGRITDRGYVVRMAIPFKSLRFPESGEQTWGIIFVRDIQRNNESSFWPRVSSRIDGRLSQAGLLRGLENISPGSNRQFIPYASARSYRALEGENDDSVEPGFRDRDADADIGLDAKFVFKDSLVLDLTANPDFSEVESDSPRVTVNQRFEVHFPEKRPFFLENAGYFRTPLNLLFTRRIVEPRIGARLSGKSGPYNIGALLIDDQTPTELADEDVSLGGERAGFGIFRLSRDILDQSSIGFMAIDRELADGFNRLASVDARFKLNDNWSSTVQAVASRTRTVGTGDEEGEELSGPAYDLLFVRSGRDLFVHSHYQDVSDGFRAQTGFVPRTDIRSFHQLTRYRFWPEGKRLINWGPNLFVERILDHSGTRLDRRINSGFHWEFRRQTRFGVYYDDAREQLRPKDFEDLPENVDFPTSLAGAWFDTRFVDALNVHLNFSSGTRINFMPFDGPDGEIPEKANVTNSEVRFTWRPTGRLRNENLYLLTRLSDRQDGGRIFTNQIARSRWSYQFNKRLTLRTILQYDTTHADPMRTSLETTKNFNADLLVTYMVNPWTALFAGVTSNYQNLYLHENPTGNTLRRTDDDFLNDSRQFFVKFSYLIRP
jgi:hypothetical protein